MCWICRANPAHPGNPHRGLASSLCGAAAVPRHDLGFPDDPTVGSEVDAHPVRHALAPGRCLPASEGYVAIVQRTEADGAAGCRGCLEATRMGARGRQGKRVQRLARHRVQDRHGDGLIVEAIGHRGNVDQRPCPGSRRRDVAVEHLWTGSGRATTSRKQSDPNHKRSEQRSVGEEPARAAYRAKHKSQCAYDGHRGAPVLRFTFCAFRIHVAVSRITFSSCL